MVLTTEVINSLINIKESYQASDALMKILFDKSAREKVFSSFLEHDKKMDRDWFHVYFEEEHANKKKYAQDFTPDALSKLLAKIVDSEPNKIGGTRLDPAAGTGSLIIQKWYADYSKHFIFDYKPSMYLYQCEELSDRALPFLIFNLMIRGMNAVVIHGDTLTREAKQIYFIQNDKDDHMAFSSINVMPHSEQIEKWFDIREWKEPAKDHLESPKYIAENYLTLLKLEARG
ncbi:MAG: N-6 DNA methylase [Carnobacterium maltaromaticum]